MDEIIAGVQVIKFYVWEKPFAKLIAAARSSEMKIILKNAYVRALYMTFSVFTTRMALYCTILSIVLMYGREAITVSKIFMISYMFTSISLSMCQSFVRGVAEALEVLVAMKRIQTFLQYEENESGKNIDTISDTQLESRNLAILLKNISAAWVAAADSNGISEKHKIKEKKNKKKLIGSYTNGKQANGFDNQPITLQNIDTEFGKGKLIGIIGEVGAGMPRNFSVFLEIRISFYKLKILAFSFIPRQIIVDSGFAWRTVSKCWFNRNKRKHFIFQSRAVELCCKRSTKYYIRRNVRSYAI